MPAPMLIRLDMRFVGVACDAALGTFVKLFHKPDIFISSSRISLSTLLLHVCMSVKDVICGPTKLLFVIILFLH